MSRVAWLDFQLLLPDMETLMEVIKALQDGVTATKYTTFVAFSVLIWDMLVTMDVEVDRIWRANKTKGTTLFLINRYMTPLLFLLDFYSQHIKDTTVEFCRAYQAVSTVLYFIPMAVIECVLIMRTHALYRNTTLLVFLSGFAVFSIFWMVGVYFVMFNFELFSPGALLGSDGCVSICTNLGVCRPLSILFWVPFLMLESINISLTLGKMYTSISAGEWRVSSRNILKILVRDGLVYYLVILAISVANFLIWIFSPYTPYVAVMLLKSLQATACSRLLLNIREALHASDDTSRWTRPSCMTPTRIGVVIERAVISDYRVEGSTSTCG